MFKKSILAFLMSAFSTVLFAQSSFKAFAGAGYGIENRIGFKGINLQGGAEFYLNNHLTGITGIDLFLSSRVSKWGSAENEGAYFRQLTPSLKLQYNTGSIPGSGFLFSGGFALRTGKTYHFESGDFHNGSFTNQRYVTEKVRGNGFMLGVGYGFPLSDHVLGKIEFTNQAFLMLNDQYTLSFKVCF
jgi:hypothetical protein